MAPLRSSRTRAGLNPEYAAANTRRGAGGVIDHDPTEGLPVRKWEYRDVTVNQNPKPAEEPSAGGYVFPNENYPWSELPLPKDFTSLAPHVQHILRRARAGNTFIKKPTSTANGHATNGANGANGTSGTKPASPAADEAEAVQSNNKPLLDDDRTFSVRRWAPSTRQDLPEKSFLAPRRPGLPPLYGHNASMGGTSGATLDAKKKTVKVQKIDPETGATKVYDVMIIEGTEHTISGQILPVPSVDPVTAPPQPPANVSTPTETNQPTNGAPIPAVPPIQAGNMPTETLAPGTVIEGVGVANEEGVVVAPAAAAAMSTLSAGAQEPNRRRPPPPPKRKKFGPGRGKKGPMKKVVFEGEGGQAMAIDKQDVVKKEGEEEEGDVDEDEGEGSEEGEIDEGEEGNDAGNTAEDAISNANNDQPPPAITLDAPESSTLAATTRTTDYPSLRVPRASEQTPQSQPGLELSNDATMVALDVQSSHGQLLTDFGALEAPQIPDPGAVPEVPTGVHGAETQPGQAPLPPLSEINLPPKPPTPLRDPEVVLAPGPEAVLAPNINQPEPTETPSAEQPILQNAVVPPLDSEPEAQIQVPNPQAQQTISLTTEPVGPVEGEAPIAAAPVSAPALETAPQLPPSLPPKPVFDSSSNPDPAPNPPAAQPEAPATIAAPTSLPPPPTTGSVIEDAATAAAEDAGINAPTLEAVADVAVVPTGLEVETGMDIKAAGEGEGEGENEGEPMELDQEEGVETGAGEGTTEAGTDTVVQDAPVAAETETEARQAEQREEQGQGQDHSQGQDHGQGEAAAAPVAAAVEEEDGGEEMDLLGRLEQGIEDGE